MASACRSAVMAGARSATSRSKTLLPKILLSPKPIPPSPFSSSTRAIPSTSALRIASVLGSVESMMPLHSAIASARLRSSIAVDSTCWSWLSQAFIWLWEGAMRPFVNVFPWGVDKKSSKKHPNH